MLSWLETGAPRTDGAAGKAPDFTVSSVCPVLRVWRYDLAFKFNMNNTALFYTKSDLENNTYFCFYRQGHLMSENTNKAGISMARLIFLNV